ncbi:hypothetical protein NLG97_g2302 [Lecanicillium saksenae]|uniref:Uncharacterized protein n=1 Tax=Lecanicillium saksenae TaxID=468837 RepID=A0ACC1R340_9HYPO|nr:hypothetical protein NLG97_g2302 [Lecanicillium saksenae]
MESDRDTFFRFFSRINPVQTHNARTVVNRQGYFDSAHEQRPMPPPSSALFATKASVATTPAALLGSSPGPPNRSVLKWFTRSRCRDPIPPATSDALFKSNSTSLAISGQLIDELEINQLLGTLESDDEYQELGDVSI